MSEYLLKNTLKTGALASILVSGLALVSIDKVSAQATPTPPPEAVRARREIPLRDANSAPRGPRRAGDERSEIFRAAREQGMRDGQLQGTDDRSRNKSYRPDKVRIYKKATNGYLSGTGNKDAYKSSYRQGFLNGYERGYNGAPQDLDEARPTPPRPEKRQVAPGEKGPVDPRGQKARPPAPNGEQPPAPDGGQPPVRKPAKQKPLPSTGDNPIPPPPTDDQKPAPPAR